MKLPNYNQEIAKQLRWFRRLVRWLRQEIKAERIIALGTIIAIIAVVLSRCDIEESQRAWVAPRGAVLEQPITKGQPIFIAVLYDNVGKQPAQSWQSAPPASQLVSLAGQGWSTFGFPKNTTCANIKNVTGGPTIFPSIAEGSYKFHFEITYPTVDDSLLNGTRGFFFDSCFSYETFRKTRYSAFCFYLAKDMASGQWAIKFCPTGNYAN